MLMLIPFGFVIMLIVLLVILFLGYVEREGVFLTLMLSVLVIAVAIPVSATVASDYTHSDISYTDETGHHEYRNIHGLSNRGNGVYWFTDEKGNDHVVTTPKMNIE